MQNEFKEIQIMWKQFLRLICRLNDYLFTNFNSGCKNDFGQMLGKNTF